MTSPRQRYRQVSPERIAKVAEALHARGLPCAVKLTTDGSALLLTGEGAESLMPMEADAVNEWDEVLPGVQ